MFYELEVKSHIRLPPTKFGEDTKKAVLEQLKEQFENYTSQELGLVIGVVEIVSIGDGIIIAGDGAAYYETDFKLITFKPELQEIVLGKITDITDFGAFINIGIIDGMIHVSQTMDDYVSFSKSNVLTGKESKKSLKVGDRCRARIIAVSFKDIANPKIGLTMRQPALGAEQWIDDDLKKAGKAPVKKTAAKK